MTSRVEPLLLEMLSFAYRIRDAPLQSRIDGIGITLASLRRCLTAEEMDRLPDADEITAAFDGIVMGALLDGAGSMGTRDDPFFRDGPPAQRNVPPRSLDPAIRALASWLERLHDRVRLVDSSAIAIVALRIQHLADREIAGKLNLGLRLVKRIVRDTCEALGGAPAA